MELDPDYLDAWAKLNDLSSMLLLPQSERDAITFKGIELDPLGRHFYANVNNVQDLKALWTVLEANTKYDVENPKTLFPMEASRKAIDEEQKKRGGRIYSGARYNARSWSYFDRRKPGQVLASQQAVAQILQLIQYACSFRESMGGNRFYSTDL